MLPPRLEKELQELGLAGWRFTILEDAYFVSVVFHEVPTSSRYNHPVTEVFVRIPRIYPESGPDMFWTSPDLHLADGRPPLGGDVLEEHAGRIWRRFSWHREKYWNPEIDWLGTHLEFVRQRFESS